MWWSCTLICIFSAYAAHGVANSASLLGLPVVKILADWRSSSTFCQCNKKLTLGSLEGLFHSTNKWALNDTMQQAVKCIPNLHVWSLGLDRFFLLCPFLFCIIFPRSFSSKVYSALMCSLGYLILRLQHMLQQTFSAGHCKAVIQYKNTICDPIWENRWSTHNNTFVVNHN